MSLFDMETVYRIIADEICDFLENEKILPEKQKRCRRKLKGTGNQLYRDKMLLQEVKGRKKNLAMGWIDCRKDYVMVSHLWVIESLNIMGGMIKSWKVEVIGGSETLGEVPIKRGTSQGDALLLLLF